MNWRPWIIASMMFAMVVTNAALLFFEDIEPPEGAAETTDAVRDPLLAMRFTPGNRKSNFKDMFGDEQLAAAAAGKIKKLEKRAEFFREKIQEHADEVSGALCPTSGIPQRYAAMSILVEAEGERKKVLGASRITYLEVRGWYSDSLVPQIYSELELSKSRPADATLMGVASILQGQEDKVLASEAPFNHRGIGRWGWAGVKKRWPEVENQVVDYFALMHMFTEIANDVNKGICI